MLNNKTSAHSYMPMLGKKLLILIIFFAGVFFIPWKYVNWGKLEYSQPATITVRGEAKQQERSQVAQFSAGVNSVNDDKEAALNEVNSKIEALIDAVKTFGIPDEDIKTQSVNVHQNEERFYEEGREKYRPGQWRVSNTIEVKLRNVDKASGLADLLTKSGATNVYGPNFMVDNTQDVEVNLMDEAIANAKKRAEKAASASGRKLGKVLTVVEGASTSRVMPMMAMEAGGGGGPAIEPGSSTVSQTVTVTFELE